MSFFNAPAPNQNFLPTESKTIFADTLCRNPLRDKAGLIVFLLDLPQRFLYRIRQLLFLRTLNFKFNNP